MTAPLRINRTQAAAETKRYAVTRDQVKHAAATLRVVVTKKYDADLPMTSEWMD